MEQSKYYTPNIEDLHINYECEQKLESEWTSFVIDHKSFLYTSLRDLETSEESLIRTKYLDTDDIISLGWQHVESHNDVQNYTLITGDKTEDQWDLRTNTFNNFIDIRQGYEWRRFFGECKSINELRIIHKLLKIN